MPEEDYAAKEAEYRSHSEKLRQMASKSTDETERTTLLRIAEAWEQLADRMKALGD
jgi:hypothetical protein